MIIPEVPSGRQEGSARPGRGEQLLSDLRRRHEAARRLPPLEPSGRRDPLTDDGLTDPGAQLPLFDEPAHVPPAPRGKRPYRRSRRAVQLALFEPEKGDPDDYGLIG